MTERYDFHNDKFTKIKTTTKLKQSTLWRRFKLIMTHYNTLHAVRYTSEEYIYRKKH